MTLLLFLLLNTCDTTQTYSRIIKNTDKERACGTFVAPKNNREKRKNIRRNKKEWGWR